MEHQLLSGVLSMMEKVAVSKLMASHTQIRRGRRPYRVETLLKRKEHEVDIPEILREEPEKQAAKDYGPGGKWIHDRAHGILEDNPETPKAIAYAVATQQAHKVSKSPKDFRTPEGVHEAKMKYDEPKSEYQKTADLKKQKQIAEVISEAIKGGLHPKKAFKMVEQGGIGALRSHAPKSYALHAFEAAEKLGSLRLSGFFDELDKIAEGGGAALGAELLGAPGAAIGGYHEGGMRGAIGGGGGALAGLGGGLVARHFIKKHLTGGEFGRKHPIASTVLEALPMAVGSTVGGALGQHLMAKRAGVGVDLRHLTKSGVTKIHMPTEESLEQAKTKLERTQRVGADLKIKPPEPNIRAVATKSK
jgi:hypothetical protein